jgi:hypothetical protein
MDLPNLLNDRMNQEADARLRRRRELQERAEIRATAREAAEEGKIASLNVQIEKWNTLGVSSANSHTLTLPVIQPLGSSVPRP